MRSIVLALFAFAPCVAFADFSGRVVKVSDGDKLTVLVAKRQIRVRLEGIDAPEIGQAFGKRSRQSLSSICAGKTAEVVERGKDRDGRTIGRVTCAGIQANNEQVRQGQAWVLTRYEPFGSPLYELETYARLRQLGLWADPSPIAPWEWRASRKAKQAAWLTRPTSRS